MNKWSELLGIPYPECKQTGQCCRFSSPSTPAVSLLEKAAKGNVFARDYFSVFVPYKSIEEVKKLHPALVDKNTHAVKTTKCKGVTEENMVFYHCRFLSNDNKCLIYEDRPTFCREFPDSPLLVLPPECGYEEWSDLCKKKYVELKDDIAEKKKRIEDLKYQRRAIRLLKQLQRINNDEYKLAFLLPSINLVSPGRSWMKFY